MKKVLIAINYTPSAEKVAETGYAIAKGLKAEVAIVHVLTEAAYYAMEYSPIMGYTGGYSTGAEQVVNDIKTEAENFLAASVKHLGDNNITTKVLEGETSDAIMQYGQEWNADLIVLGSHSHHGLDRLFGTDVAHHILKHSAIPLLTIPTDDK
jgi:nucleotide-binding universal stress UspA family protein